MQRLAKTAEKAHFRAAREAKRAALLTLLSRDLCTPLATMLGAITSLRELAEHLSPGARDDLALAIEQEAPRLSNRVDNLLQMAQLRAGLDLRLDWEDPIDVTRSAIIRACTAQP